MILKVVHMTGEKTHVTNYHSENNILYIYVNFSHLNFHS